jgi:O-6-methylguanine DNA methyltransferase
VAALARLRGGGHLAFHLKEQSMLRIDSLDTPLGTIHLAARGDALVALNFGVPLEGERAPSEAAERLRAYFEGDVRALDELRVDPAGTSFQKRVWSLLREIPAGETRSYSELAGLLGSHPRAVGAANGANPVALVIPCHRVIAKDGSLCGYAFGEERKRWLIEHERAAATSWLAPRRAGSSPRP